MLTARDESEAIRSLIEELKKAETVFHLFDFGLSLQKLSGAVMRLPIWDVLTGAAASNSESIATYLRTTVNGVAPSAATLASAVAQLDAETDTTHGNFLWHLAESTANQTQVGFVTTGLEFGRPSLNCRPVPAVGPRHDALHRSGACPGLLVEARE